MRSRLVVVFITVLFVIGSLQGCGKKKEGGTIPSTSGGGGGSSSSSVSISGGCVTLNSDRSATFNFFSTNTVQVGYTGLLSIGVANIGTNGIGGGTYYYRNSYGANIEFYLQNNGNGTATFNGTAHIKQQVVDSMVDIDTNGESSNYLCVDRIQFEYTGLSASGDMYGVIRLIGNNGYWVLL